MKKRNYSFRVLAPQRRFWRWSCWPRTASLPACTYLKRFVRIRYGDRLRNGKRIHQRYTAMLSVNRITDELINSQRNLAEKRKIRLSRRSKSFTELRNAFCALVQTFVKLDNEKWWQWLSPRTILSADLSAATFTLVPTGKQFVQPSKLLGQQVRIPHLHSLFKNGLTISTYPSLIKCIQMWHSSGPMVSPTDMIKISIIISVLLKMSWM